VSWPLVFDVSLCLLLVAVALGAVLVRDLFASAVFFIVYGLFVAVAWVRLGAVDVALAEAAIGAGLTGVLLVRAVARLQERPPGSAPVSRRAASGRAVAAVLCVALFVALAHAVLTISPAGGLAGQVAADLPATGVSNPVTAVLLNFRGYDTLLETVVLLVALVGVWSVGADECWGARPGLGDHARPGGVLASFARLLPPIGLLVGIHLFWAGAQAPGGAFQAGTILAAVWLLATMAGIANAPPVSSPSLRWLVAFGPLLFLAVAVAAIPFGAFLVFPPAHAKAIVLLVEAGLTLSIAATLGLLVMGPPARRA
jgi:multisubunit Na+/H+ antiporter MnhB subunit